MPLNHRSFLAILALLLVTAGPMSAQVQNGTPPFGSYGGGPDIVDLANLNVRLSIPVLHKAGRGTDFTYDLNYDSSVWFPVTVNGTTTWTPVVNWAWAGSVPTGSGYATYKSLTTSCQYYNTDLKRWITEHYVQYSNWGYVDSFGISHALDSSKKVQDGGATDCGPAYNTSIRAVDGSGYILNVDGGPDASVTAKDGSTGNNLPLQAPAPKVGWTDRNGNEITVTSAGSFYDTLSSKVAVLTVTGSGNPSNPVTLSYAAPGGGTQFKMNYSPFNIKTNFGCGGIGEYSANGINLVSSITLPDGSSYTFSYEATPGNSGDYTGRLHSVQLPTGGTITYSYSGGYNGINCADGSAATLTRTTPDGTWTYAQVKGSGAASTTTLTDPQGNVSTIQFQGIYETQRVVNDVHLGTLATTNTCYNTAAPPEPACTTAVTLPITQRYISTQLGGGSLTDLHYQKFDTYGNLQEQDDYDYGSGANGGLLKRTVITYASLGNIAAFPQTVTVTDGSGHTVSQTNYNYDNGSVTGTSGTPQQILVSGSRGNVTSVNYYTSGSTYLTKSYTYFDTGNVQFATDVNNAITTYMYPDATSTCGNAFPTSLNEPLSLSRSFTWNCTGGVLTSVKDENSQTTYIAYNDPDYWRPATITDPTGATVGYSYQPNPTNCCPWMIAAQLPFNNNNSITMDVQYLDGLGRTYVDQHPQHFNTGTLDTVSYAFDANGRPYSVSMPCVAGWAATCSTPKTTQTYDALNRPLVTTDGGTGTVSYSYPNNDVLVTIGPAPSGENTKRRQLEYDSLGRLTSVCEITSAAGSGTCGQNSPQTGYWTKYTYNPLGQITGVTQNAQSSSTQTRTYAYDLMGRLTSETNPESGTTTYVWDTSYPPLGCGTPTGGDISAIAHADGRGLCFEHDSLHRMTGEGTSDLLCRFFVYDSATVNGQVMSNAKGRLAEAWTAQGPSCSPVLTDEGFSYTQRGEVSDMWESTPHSGGYYHTNTTYWPNGALASLSGIPGLPTYTFGVDGEGRNNSASQGSTGLVSSALFNAASQVTDINFTNGDHDHYQYDPNTSRETQYSFTIGATPQTETGTLTWNANGTLQRLAITDPFNSSDNQTCSYSHDDLVRIASVSCTSTPAWSQTFSYDAFGNITKSGSISWQPGYDTTKNRYLPSSGSSYDSDGNLLSDPFNTYAWNGYGQPTTISTRAITYDALGRQVERSTSGTYDWSVIYTPIGKAAYGQGQSFNGLVLDLPGGARTEAYNGYPQWFQHMDWLRSSRLMSTMTARTVAGTEAYAPYGETYAASGVNGTMFAGTFYDTAPTTYDADARRLNPNQGRWISPDPAGLAAVDPTNPQSWNRYAYVTNNPLAFLDPLGLFKCYNQDGSEIPATSEADCTRQGGIVSGGATTITVYGTPGLVPPIIYLPPPGLVDGGGGNGSGPSPTWAAIKTFFTPPSTGPGSCLAVFSNSVQGSVGTAAQSLGMNVQKYGPALASGLAGSGVTAAQAEEVAGAMVAGGQLSPALGAVATNVISGTAPLAAEAAPYVLRAGGTFAVGLFDVALLKGVADEVRAALKGQCKP